MTSYDTSIKKVNYQIGNSLISFKWRTKTITTYYAVVSSLDHDQKPRL